MRLGPSQQCHRNAEDRFTRDWPEIPSISTMEFPREMNSNEFSQDIHSSESGALGWDSDDLAWSDESTGLHSRDPKG